MATPTNLTETESLELLDETLAFAGDMTAEDADHYIDEYVSRAARDLRLRVNDNDRAAVAALAYEQLAAR